MLYCNICGFIDRFAVCAVVAIDTKPTNGRALEVFLHHVTDLWRRMLRRRSSLASSPRIPAVGYYQGTLLRNEIEAREAGRSQYSASPPRRAPPDRFGGRPAND